MAQVQSLLAIKLLGEARRLRGTGLGVGDGVGDGVAVAVGEGTCVGKDAGVGEGKLLADVVAVGCNVELVGVVDGVDAPD